MFVRNDVAVDQIAMSFFSRRRRGNSLTILFVVFVGVTFVILAFQRLDPLSPPKAITPIHYYFINVSCPKPTFDEKSLLSELLLDVIGAKPILMTMANQASLQLVLNWVHHLKLLNISTFVVAALDSATWSSLYSKGISTFLVNSDLNTSDEAPWGSLEFHKIGRIRVCLLEVVLELGFGVIFSDSDVVFLRNPLEYFDLYPESHLLVSSDSLSSTSTSEKLEPDSKIHALNVGILMVRPTALSFMSDWKQMLLADPMLWEQAVFQELIQSSASVQWYETISKQRENRIVAGVLPVVFFCNGHVYFIDRIPQRLSIKPFAVHATFQFSGLAGKQFRFKENLLWNSLPDYFHHPGGFLAFQVHVDLQIWTPTVEGHFNLLNQQLLQIRRGVAIAQKLDRVLVLPELICGMDRYWAPHAGRIPGSTLSLPFYCPLDHVFNLAEWTKLSSKPSGVEFRESSFMHNPSRPSDLTIKEIRLNSNVSYVGAVDSLKSEAASTILVISDLTSPNLDPIDVDKSKALKETMNSITDLWCCMEGHVPGHVWYDAFWDTIPHTDQHGRLWSSRWRPLPGP